MQAEKETKRQKEKETEKTRENFYEIGTLFAFVSHEFIKRKFIMEQQKIKSYRDLLIWQKSIIFVTEIYKVTNHFPRQETFGLCIQIRKSSISIPSNIAEGYSRYSNKEFIRFLSIIIGSLSELQTQLQIALNLEYILLDDYEILNEKSKEIERMICSLIRKLKAK